MAISNDILAGVKDQISDLKAAELQKKVKIDAMVQELANLQTLIGGIPTDANNIILLRITTQIKAIQSGTLGYEDFGPALGDLDTLALMIPASNNIQANQMISGIIVQIENLLNYRPDVESVLSDLDAIKNLKGGPADATSFHDFNVLQIAFKSVWKHAFDKNVQAMVEQIYLEHTKLYDDAGLTLPPFGAIDDIDQLEEFLGTSLKSIPPPTDIRTVSNPDYDQAQANWVASMNNSLLGSFMNLSYNVPSVIPAVDLNAVLSTFQAGWIWGQLSPEQQYIIWEKADIVNDPARSDKEKEDARRMANAILSSPEGPGGRIVKLMYKLGQAVSEPYAFDVFAPHSYNFGLMLTYRQKWEPGQYQAGNLVSTIPLAPGETRKYSKKETVKRTRAEKEIEKSMSSSSYSSSETARAESEIMKKSTSNTNFKMSADGSFNIGIGSINSATEFSTNQGSESVSNKRDFRESTIKASQDYRLERNLEVDTTMSDETETTTSGEISNPNNEITVTYLFYELQRRYKISEFLYRVRPVIMIALDVPAPHEIDEAWLIQYQWIISRVLLDDSLRAALNYLSSGFAGDEVSADILRSNWENQLKIFNSQDKLVTDLISKRDWLREAVVRSQLQEDVTKSYDVNTFVNVLSFGMANQATDMAADQLDAYNKAYQARLGYVDQVLGDAQSKLKQVTETYQQATKDYAAAMQNQYSRHVAIDQLRIHVKQNILYYMQAIWDHKVADQTFFELYKLPIDCPDSSSADFTPPWIKFLGSANNITNDTLVSSIFNLPTPSSSWDQHELIEMADLDNPLGYKGNYIIFPLKQHCYLTDFMIQEFIDDFTLGLKDPDDLANFLENFDRLWQATITNADGTPNTTGKVLFNGQSLGQDDLKSQLANYADTVRRSVDEIIVPTGQLFIEALPGSHPLLEDFKLLHRVEDVRKVRAEVRHAELENLRLAERIYEGKLEDPDIDKKIVVKGGGSVAVNA